MNKQKIATKLNKGIKKGRFSSDAWVERKEAIANRVKKNSVKKK